MKIIIFLNSGDEITSISKTLKKELLCLIRVDFNEQKQYF